MTIVNRVMQRARGAMRGFASDARGNVAMIAAFVIPVLLLITFGGIDIHRASTVKANLQDALDAATLAAARSQYTANADLTRVGLASLQANLAPYQQITLLTDQTTFTVNSAGTVTGNARVSVSALVANLILPMVGQGTGDQIPVGARSEVVRTSQNVEVALVLDTTGSMEGTKIADLKLAAKDLVDIVVQDQQTPYYSKVSIVPYSMAVNLGASGATAARGAPATSTGITAITWYRGTPKLVTAATRASTATITADGHGFANGDKVVIWGQDSMSQMNGRIFTVTGRQTNSFQLSGVSSSYWSSFSNNRETYVAECARTDCNPTVTAASHGIPNSSGNTVYLTDIGGMDQLNDRGYNVTYVSASQYRLNTVGYGVYSTGGRSWCGQYGCSWRVFTNAEGNLRSYAASTCVTERTGGNAYRDVSPSTTRVSYNYASPSNPCIPNLVRPLSNSISTIKTQIDALTASGSTGGHIGVAWGWYTVSPNFNSVWSSGGAAGAYSNDNLKAVVIMTDGEYNSSYCSGVISRDSTYGSGGNDTHIDCDAPNGSSFNQTQALCAAMKQAGVIVYTVGFQVVNDQRARDLVNGCATSPDHVYMPTSGSDLRQSFQAIGRDITALRIAR